MLPNTYCHFLFLDIFCSHFHCHLHYARKKILILPRITYLLYLHSASFINEKKVLVAFFFFLLLAKVNFFFMSLFKIFTSSHFFCELSDFFCCCCSLVFAKSQWNDLPAKSRLEPRIVRPWEVILCLF